MAQAIEEELLQAIEKDDIKAFNALMDKAQCGRYRLGRFPVLSLLYLYSSHAIISAYEDKFVKISAWEELNEPARIVKRFSKKAGKCLRLYFNRVVSPLEMLLILDRTKRLKRIYPLVKPSEAVKSRLKTIYYVKYSLGIKFEGDEIIIDRRPLNRSEKKKLIALCVSGFLAVSIAVATPTTCVALFGRRSGGDVTRLSHIDFGAQTTYTLKKDIVIPENYSVEKVNCNITGGGHKIILGKNASLGELGSKVSDVEICTYGSPIFSVCTEDAALLNVTVTVDADVKTIESSALIAVANYGTFDGVTMNVDGKISAVAGGEDDVIFGGMVAANANTIKNCTINYCNLSLEGETVANATFGGIVGINNGIVQDCLVTGAITSSTFDLAGVCYVNYNEISGIINEANLSQTSDDNGWYPVVGGIVIDNVGIVSHCQNMGDINVKGQLEATCGGIAARTYFEIVYCLSSGEISVTAPTACVGGIFGSSGVATDGWDTYLFGYADHCISQVKITADIGESRAYVGGIGGYIKDYQVDEKKNIYIGGCILNCIFTGELDESLNYSGNIVGVCGEKIYEANSYSSGGTKHPIFEGNYYIKNALPPFGAVEMIDEETEERFLQVEGKGVELKTEEEIKNTETYKNILKELGL